jgi:hypothetical protein
MSVPDKIQKKAEQLDKHEQARSVAHFEKGINKCGDLSKGMSLLMSDLLSERVSTSVANAVCNSAGKMLKAVEMQQRYGKSTTGGNKELGLLE